MPFCPNCGSEKVLPSTRRSWWRGVQQSLGLRHFLCDECYHRFTVRGNQADGSAPPKLPPLAPAGEAAGEPYLPDGPIYLEPMETAPSPDQLREPSPEPAARQSTPSLRSEAEVDSESGLGSAPRMAPAAELEPEPGLSPATGFGPARRGGGLESLQPSLDFAGPGLDNEADAGSHHRAALPWLGLWRKLGLALALLLICVALLLWYRLNLDSTPEAQAPEPQAQAKLREEPLSLPPAPAPPGMESAVPAAKPAPAVGAIPPPSTEIPSPRGAIQPWTEPALPLPTTKVPTASRAATPSPTPPGPALAPSAKPQPLEDKPPAPVAAKPAPTRKPAPKAAPGKTVPPRTASKSKAGAQAGGFTLQFGAFSDQDRAMVLAAKLKGMGYKVDLVQGAASNGRILTKVRSGHFASAQEARKARAKAAALSAMEVVVVPPPRP